jgi:hypothetical protein
VPLLLLGAVSRDQMPHSAAAALFLGFPFSWFFREEEAPDATPSRKD